ncbi:MAG: sigma 54-interacting transcriptional regulator, partial [Desulfobacterales bacterium]
MAAAKIDANLKSLEKKCRILESQCSEYVKALEKTNQRLEREIRKHKATGIRLKVSEERFRGIFEYGPFGAAMIEANGKIVLANKALCNMLGYEKDDIEKMSMADLTHPDDIDLDLRLFKKLTEKKIAHYGIEKRYRCKNGKVIWGSVALSLAKNTADKDDLIIGMVEDISQRKKYEDEVKRSRDDLERVVAQRTAEIHRLKDRLQAENLFLKQELADTQSYGTIIGQSHSIKSVVSQIELVSPTDANVLIQGQSGTGKELIARELHKHSRRGDRPLVKVNCAAIPKDLYESEFFGHVKGAFTGAVKDRVGRFEAADGGTIFLDEVGEIPVDLQSKLLRVLQEGQYERVGCDRTRSVDVRVIAATNRDLKTEVRARRFRDDLFYRLNVFPIHVAPLKERTDDIPLLAAHFIIRLSREMNLPTPRLTKANIMDLQKYDWPGNVRELENVVERALILARSDTLRFDLGPELDTGAAKANRSSPGQPAATETVLSSHDLFEFERNNTLRALERCNWKIYG